MPEAPVPISFDPCCVHVVPLRTKIHAAPMLLLSWGPPTMAVLPSEEMATPRPCWESPPLEPVPTNFGPCCTNCADAVPDESRTAPARRTTAAWRRIDSCAYRRVRTIQRAPPTA